MQPLDLIDVAAVLADAGGGSPNSACLRRAASSVYYAMFHHLARECANLLIGKEDAIRSNEAWHQVYRALDHGYTKGQCKNTTIIKKFPKGIEDFANLFISMQGKRHSADYDPAAAFTRSEVINNIDLVRQSLCDFSAASDADRRAFCAFVLFKERKL